MKHATTVLGYEIYASFSLTLQKILIPAGRGVTQERSVELQGHNEGSGQDAT